MPEEIRQIRADEIGAYANMAAQAFQVEAAAAERWRRSMRPEEIYGLFVDGQMRAALTLLDQQIWLGAAPVRAGGLAGVATPPEWRRQGYIGRLLRAILDVMREQTQPISLLYPFYFPFYKHYGWEHVSDNHVYTMPITRLPPVAPTGTWHPVCIGTDPPAPEGQEAVSDADLVVLRGIYDAWVVGRAGPLVRDAGHWRRRRIGRASNVYYWRDAAGQPRAYVIYTFKQLAGWERELQVRELVALDPAALGVALGFLRNHDSQAKEVRLELAEESRLPALLEDPRIKAEIEPGFMLRLLNVPAALAARSYPPGFAGRLVLQVAEGWVERTAHTYTLDVAGGHGAAQPSTAEPELSLDQRALAQLYAGYLTAHQAADLGLLQVHDPAALGRAAALFAGPRPFMPDFF